MKETQVRRTTAEMPEESAESNGLLWLLLSGALFILIFLPVVS